MSTSQPKPRPLASQLYRFPQQAIPVGAACRSHRHLIRAGCLMPGSAPGSLALCPLLSRSLDKLCRLVRLRMGALGAQRLTLPMLGAAALWQKTGRWEAMGAEMFRFADRQGRQLCLQPTHEEEVTRLVSMGMRLSPRSLPLLVYQLHWKFRDEPCPKHGLLRAREFLMKDMYSFHVDEACARRTYDKVCAAYASLLGEDLGLPWIRARASAGAMGGTESAEFHVLAAPGEDRLAGCVPCGVPWRNAECEENAIKCPHPITQCQAQSQVPGLEVGHCFLLGSELYPSAFKLHVHDEDNKDDKDTSRRLVTMACYGIGVSRLLAACAEAASTETELRWPRAVAPYRLALCLPKAGARDRLSDEVAERLIRALEAQEGDILIDDRHRLTIGGRVRDHRLWGLPHTLVAKGLSDGRIGCELLDNYNPEASTGSQRGVVDGPEEFARLASELLGQAAGTAGAPRVGVVQQRGAS